MHHCCRHDQFGDLKTAYNRAQRTVRALLSAVGIALLAVSPAAAQSAVREGPPENQFFCFKATYVVKATGEVVRFDLVRACLAQYAKDVFGTPSAWGRDREAAGRQDRTAVNECASRRVAA
jgi:hypothetical protein